MRRCWRGVGERHALIVDQLNAISARYDAFSAVRAPVC